MMSSCLNNTDTSTLTDIETLSAQEYLDQAIANVDQDQLAADLLIIDDSLAVAGLTDQVMRELNGVRYLVDSLGTGATPTLESFVRIKYSGKVLGNGIEFDANESYENFLYGLIIGLQITMPLLPTGTVATLYIPSVYGYGATEFYDASGQLIPANSILVFEVELLEVF